MAHGIDIVGFAVGCEAHDLVLIAILRKAEILRDGEVQQTEASAEKIRGGGCRAIVSRPMAHDVLTKSPKPSMAHTAASSNGETKNALARCAG